MFWLGPERRMLLHTHTHTHTHTQTGLCLPRVLERGARCDAGSEHAVPLLDWRMPPSVSGAALPFVIPAWIISVETIMSSHFLPKVHCIHNSYFLVPLSPPFFLVHHTLSPSLLTCPPFSSLFLSLSLLIHPLFSLFLQYSLSLLTPFSIFFF